MDDFGVARARLLACADTPLDKYCCLFWKALGESASDRKPNDAFCPDDKDFSA